MALGGETLSARPHRSTCQRGTWKSQARAWERWWEGRVRPTVRVPHRCGARAGPPGVNPTSVGVDGTLGVPDTSGPLGQTVQMPPPDGQDAGGWTLSDCSW